MEIEIGSKTACFNRREYVEKGIATQVLHGCLITSQGGHHLSRNIINCPRRSIIKAVKINTLKANCPRHANLAYTPKHAARGMVQVKELRQGKKMTFSNHPNRKNMKVRMCRIIVSKGKKPYVPYTDTNADVPLLTVSHIVNQHMRKINAWCIFTL